MTHDSGRAYIQSMAVAFDGSDTRVLDATLRGELRDLENRLRREIRDAELRQRAEIRELDLRLSGAEAAAMRAELIRWIVGTWAAAVLAVGGMLVAAAIVILSALPHS